MISHIGHIIGIPFFKRKGIIPIPKSVTATVKSDTEIDLSWVSKFAVSVERSIDEETFTEVGTTAAGDNAYSDTGLTADTTYYYRIRAFVDSVYSMYSPIVSEETLP